MNAFIQNLKQKPEPIRQRWVITLALGGTFLAFMIWVISLTAGSPSPVLVSNDAVSPAFVQQSGEADGFKSPFSLGVETVADQFRAVGSGWQVLTKKAKLMFE